MFALSQLAKNKTFTQKMVKNAAQIVAANNNSFSAGALRPTESGGRIRVVDQA